MRYVNQIKFIFLVALVCLLLGHTSLVVSQDKKTVASPLSSDDCFCTRRSPPTDLSTAGVDVIVATIEVDAPVDGHVFVSFSTNLVHFGDATPVICDISQNGGPSTRGINFELVGGVYIPHYNRNFFSISYPVDAGLDEFVVTCAQEGGETNTTRVQDTYINAVFSVDPIEKKY